MFVNAFLDDVPSKPRSAPAEVGNSESSEDETGEYSYDEHETRQMRLRNVYLKSLPSLSYLENEIARILAGKLENKKLSSVDIKKTCYIVSISIYFFYLGFN